MEGSDQIIDLDTLTTTDSGIVFQFYKDSFDAPAGKGSGEKIEPPERRLEFPDLSSKGKFPNWRRKLDNSWIHEDTPFFLDERHWNSVEHYVRANFFKKTAPGFYEKFSADSGVVPLSNSLKHAVAATSKSGKLDGETIRPEDVNMDPEFPGKNEKEATFEAMSAKFSQIPHFRELLTSTKKATLKKYKKGSKPEIDTNLIRIRSAL